GDFTLTVTATDDNGASSDAIEFTLSIEDINQAPNADPIPAQSVAADDDYEFDITGFFSDPDPNDTLTYEVSGTLPPGLEFVDGKFEGTATTAGSYQVTVTATDNGGLSTPQTFVFNVTGDARDIVRIEAEDFDLENSAFFGELPNDPTRIRLLPNQTGETTYAISDLGNPDVSGNYNVAVRFFDENDGVASARLLYSPDGVADFIEIGAWDFDDPNGGNAAQEASARILTFSGLEVGPNTVLKIEGTSTQAEFVRIDYLELIPVSPDTNFAPVVDVDLDVNQSVNGLNGIAFTLPEDVFTDQDEDPLTYGLKDSPPWLSIDPTTGEITGDAPAGGDYDVTVTATDGPDASHITVEKTFTLTVIDTNAGPVFVFGPETITVLEGGTVEDQIQFTDPDGVTYSFADGAPDWLQIDGQTGVISGTPDNDDVGGPFDVDVVATDGFGVSTTKTISVTVENVNAAPVAGPAIDAQAAAFDTAFTFELPADAFSDEDAGDTLTFSATLQDGSPLPDWLTIDPQTGTLSGTPDLLGDLVVTVTATDTGGLSDTQTIAIDVTADPVVIEAEDLSGVGTATNYEVNQVTTASGGELIRITNVANPGIITHDLSEYAGGGLTLGVSFLDETDGISTATAFVDGVEIGSWSFDGTEGTQNVPGAETGNFIQEGNYRTITFDNAFFVNEGAELRIEVVGDNGEFGRIDSIILT
ncbi:MAG: putative Ig domain-containing protein, partial [Pseudomonadota bacterium]